MPFRQTLLKVETADGWHFRLLEPFEYVTAVGGPLARIVVPAGTESDGASTPQAIWNLIPPFGAYWRAAFLHDYLYRDTSATREFADAVFLEAMENLGVDALTRKTIYEAVRAAGQAAFDGDRQAREQQAGMGDAKNNPGTKGQR
jgi:hypothetical protein